MENPFSIVIEKVEDLALKVERALNSQLNEHGLPRHEFMRIEEAAEYMGLKASTLKTYTRERKIRHYKRSGIFYFKRTDINDYIQRGVVESNVTFNNKATYKGLSS